MKWRLSTETDLQDIINFLLKDEWLHIQALSLYSENGKYFYPKSNSVLTIIRKIDTSISGVIVLSSRGLIYPMFNSCSLGSKAEKEELIKILATVNMRVHGALGLAQDVDYLDSIIFNRIRGINNYLILHRPDNRIFSIDQGLDIKKAQIKDLNKLVTLEYEYQKEEVLLNPADLNRKATKENFKNKLKTDDIYYIEGKNIPLAKASSTFKSPHYTLIGGVFTWKEQRNRGYGTELLKYLLNDQLSRGLKGALFVKKDNKAALKIYIKLGFIEQKPYKINYYYN